MKKRPWILASILLVTALVTMGAMFQSNFRYHTDYVAYSTPACFEASTNSGIDACVKRTGAAALAITDAAGTAGGAALTTGDTTVASAKTLAVTSADKLTVAGLIVPQHVILTFYGQTTEAATDRVIFLADRAYQVVGITEIHGVAAGGASTLQVVKDTGTTAPGAGTDILQSTGFDLNGTANTLQTGTLTATTADLQLAAGNRLSIDFANTIQSTAGLVIQVTLKRI